MFTVIGLMLVIDMIIINHFQNKLDQHSKALSIIYKNQSSIETISLTSNKIFKANEFDIKDEILMTSAEISQNIDLLIQGGQVPNTDLVIGPVKGRIGKQVSDLNKHWKEAISVLNAIHTTPIKIDSVLKEEVVKTEFIDSTYQKVTYSVDRIILVPNPKIKKALTQFTSYKKLLFQALGSLMSSFILDFEKQRQKYDVVLIVMLIANLAIVGSFLFLMIMVVIQPLGKIGSLTEKIANGEDEDINYSKSDEIGSIVASVKSLGSHIKHAADFVHHIGEGNLEVQLKGFDQEKEKQGSLAHALIAMQDKLKIVSQEDLIRNWATKGMANFAEILRNNNSDLHSLGDAILAELISYTEANIGCIYVPDQSENSTRLELIAFYAYDTKKHFNQSVEIGEGLIGQTFVEKKTTYLLEIPEDYISIKSGVGESSPGSILVVPLKVNENIFGVLEIASLKEFSKEQIDFIEKVGETIAGTIYNVKNAEQTKKLLEDSQELTEQMRAQEEEMRQNMEELSATQEEAARKELQSTSSLEAFNNSVATIEIDSNGIIVSVNAVFIELTDQSKNTIIGTHISSFLETIDDESLASILQSTFESKQSSAAKLSLASKNSSRINVAAHLSHLHSENVLLICYPSSAEVSSSQPPFSELEEELTQNLDMLEVTHQTLNEKLKLLQHSFVYFEINSEDEIISHNSKMNDLLKISNIEAIGQKFTDLLILDIDSMKLIKDQINQSNSYSDTVRVGGDKKIMLYIEQRIDKM